MENTSIIPLQIAVARYKWCNEIDREWNRTSGTKNEWQQFNIFHDIINFYEAIKRGSLLCVFAPSPRLHVFCSGAFFLSLFFYTLVLSLSLSLLLSLLFKLLIFWISGNHNHLYALRTLSRTCHFHQTMYNDAGDERPVNRRNMRMKRSKRTHRVRREQNERKEQPPPSQQRIIENEWKWDTEVQTNTKKNERHERIITVIFIGK